MLKSSVKIAAVLGAACISAAMGLSTLAWGQPSGAIGDKGVGAGVISTGTGPHALADAAYKAMGLTDEKLAPAVVTLNIKGTVQAWDPGESESVNDPYKPDWGTSTFTESYDRARGLYRIEWVRPRAGGGMRTYTEILTDEYGTAMGGYVMGVDVNGGQPMRAVQINGMPAHQMSGKRLTATLRELERYTVLGDMHEHPERVSEIANQRAGGKTYPAAQYRSRSRHLHRAVRSHDSFAGGGPDARLGRALWRFRLRRDALRLARRRNGHQAAVPPAHYDQRHQDFRHRSWTMSG